MPTIALSGCLIGGSSKTEVTGVHVGPETIAQLRPGTTKAFVLALLGEPTSKTDLGDGSALWKWAYSERKTSSGAVLFVFGSETKHETTSTCYVEFKDDIVQRAWRDG
jgi:outer membrane protein assembly factor BamE (lipoprotein component of BamABCDE complex)